MSVLINFQGYFLNFKRQNYCLPQPRLFSDPKLFPQKYFSLLANRDKRNLHTGKSVFIHPQKNKYVEEASTFLIASACDSGTNPRDTEPQPLVSRGEWGRHSWHPAPCPEASHTGKHHVQEAFGEGVRVIASLDAWHPYKQPLRSPTRSPVSHPALQLSPTCRNGGLQESVTFNPPVVLLTIQVEIAKSHTLGQFLDS